MAPTYNWEVMYMFRSACTKLLVSLKPTYKKNRRSDRGSFGPFLSSITSALMGQATHWTKFAFTLGLSPLAFGPMTLAMPTPLDSPSREKKLIKTFTDKNYQFF